MTLRRLVLWRHGETDWNADRRMQGQLNSKLTEIGLMQARKAAPVIAEFDPRLLLTSDLHRAAATAAVLTECIGLPAQVDPRLRETHLGEWQGLTHADVDARWPGAMAAWRRDALSAPPGGETRVQVAARAQQVVAELVAGQTAPVAVLCAHGGLIASLVASLLGLPVERWPSLGAIGNCHWAVLDRLNWPVGADGWSGVNGPPPQWRLVIYNAGLAE